jgi:hypothetical protein
VTKTAVTAEEWPALAVQAMGEAAVEFPDLHLRPDADGILIEGAGGVTAGCVGVVPVSARVGHVRFHLVRSPPHALTVGDARALVESLRRIAACGAWLERRLDVLVIL